MSITLLTEMRILELRNVNMASGTDNSIDLLKGGELFMPTKDGNEVAYTRILDDDSTNYITNDVFDAGKVVVAFDDAFYNVQVGQKPGIISGGAFEYTTDILVPDVTYEAGDAVCPAMYIDADLKKRITLVPKGTAATPAMTGTAAGTVFVVSAAVVGLITSVGTGEATFKVTL